MSLRLEHNIILLRIRTPALKFMQWKLLRWVETCIYNFIWCWQDCQWVVKVIKDSPWCRSWWHKPELLWCLCRSHICSSSTRSQSDRPVNKTKTGTHDELHTYYILHIIFLLMVLLVSQLYEELFMSLNHFARSNWTGLLHSRLVCDLAKEKVCFMCRLLSWCRCQQSAGQSLHHLLSWPLSLRSTSVRSTQPAWSSCSRLNCWCHELALISSFYISRTDVTFF